MDKLNNLTGDIEAISNLPTTVNENAALGITPKINNGKLFFY
jgi:hypothetical protein